MKALTIEFLARRSYAGAALVCLALAGCAIAAHQTLRVIGLREQIALAQAHAASQRALAAIASAAAPALPHPYLADARIVADMAAFGMGGVLAALEAAREPGSRALSIHIDAAERTARAEFQVDGLAQAVALLSSLNAEDPKLRWTLLQVQAGPAGQPGVATLVSRAAANEH